MSGSRAARVQGWIAGLCGATCVVGSAAARDPVRFSYAREAGAEACPVEAQVRKAIVARLGYDAFVPSAAPAVQVSVARDGEMLRAGVRLVGAGGAVEGSRSLEAPAGQCDELIEAVALAVSLALDPETIVVLVPVPSPPPAIAANAHADVGPVETAPSVDAAPPSAARPPLRVSVGAGAQLSTGTAPSPAWGATVFGEGAIGALSLGLELRFDPSVSAALPGGGTMHTSLATASLAPCARPLGAVFVCALVTAGVFDAGSEGLTRATSRSAFFAAAGGRVGLEAPLYGALHARVHGDLVANATRHELDVDGAPAFSVSALSGAGGFDLAVRF